MPASIPEPDLSRARDRVLRLMAIPGASGREAAVAKAIRQDLITAGADPASIRHDEAQLHGERPGGEVGNLIFTLPGTLPGPRRLLMAHIDTVPLCEGCQPMIDGDLVRSADPKTALGADNRAGSAAILTAAVELLTQDLPHPPVTFLWCVQEEIGLQGSKHVRLADLGNPEQGFNWDGGTWEQVTIGANGGYRIRIVVHGRASHAGVDPAAGVSAITVASLAIARLHEGGWLGLVEKNGRLGTSNLGVITGGSATNVVADRVELTAEVRSHVREFRSEMFAKFEEAFHTAAAEVTSRDGISARVDFTGNLQYESFLLDETEPTVAIARNIVMSLGGTPELRVTNGGLDANSLSGRHGLPTVTFGCGQRDVHTTAETLHLPSYEMACRTALRLAIGQI
jgi:tripeptide aminopeptidase